jgi:phage gp36-like protein
VPYTDKTFFLTKIDQAELDKLTGGVDANLDSAIAFADSMIDSYLTGVVSQLPLQTPPEVIRQMSYDIAVFSMHDRIQYADIPERVKSKYDAAVFYLKDIARGQANIPGLAVEDKTEGISYEVNPIVFDRGSI